MEPFSENKKELIQNVILKLLNKLSTKSLIILVKFN